MRYKTETDAGTVSSSTGKTSCINHKVTALNEILSTLCPNHRKLLTTMLKCLIQEKDASNEQCRDPRLSQCPNSSSDFNENKVSEELCNCNGFRWCESCSVRSVQPVPFPWVPHYSCMKDLRCLSCKNGTLGCFTIITNGVCKECNKSNIYQIHTGSYKHFSGRIYTEGATIQACSELPVEEACNIEATESSVLTYNVKDYSRPRSPSPPPLSPVRSNGFEIDEISKTVSALDANIELVIAQPPSLSPEEEEDCGPGVSNQIQTKSKFVEKVKQGSDEFEVVDGEISRSPESENDLEKGENSASFQEVMERINEKLKSIETTDGGQILANLSNSDCYQGNNSFKLREIATTLLHKAKVSDYSLMELLKQHEENRIIQTRFRKRQETLIALHNSPDSPSSRRQTVQIKRDLANLDQLFLSEKSISEKFGKKSSKNGIRDASSPDQEYPLISEDLRNVNNMNTYLSNFPDQYEVEFKNLSEECVASGTKDVTECLNSSKVVSDSDLLNIPEVDEISVETPRDNTEKPTAEHGCKETPVAVENSEKMDCSTNIGRAKRNILPPERFSIYITEPRKMFYAACFSENLQRRPIKAKKSDMAFENSACKMSNTDSPMEQGLHNEQDSVVVYEVTESLEVSASSQPELLKGINSNSIDSSLGNKEHRNEPNLPEVIIHTSQEPNELMDQYNNKKQKTTVVLNADPLETVCSMEHNGSAQPDTCIDSCTKDSSKFVDKCGTLENAVNNLLSRAPESGARSILDSNSSLANDCPSADPPLQHRCQHHAICECSVHENTGSTNKAQMSQNCSVKYNSPIKLMFLSKMSSEKGFKYTLTSVSSSKLDTNSCISKIGPEDILKASVEDDSSASESGNTVEYFQDSSAKSNPVEYVQNSTESGNMTDCMQSCTESSPRACEEVNCNLEMDTFRGSNSHCCSNSYARNDAEVEITDQMVEMTVASKEMDESILKRKPGRPKKLGPPVEKQVKRPKGRPPKPKAELLEPVECTAKASDFEKLNTSYPCFIDDSCNIRITVVYGRSRRFKRFVSENNKIVASHLTNTNESDLKQTCEKQTEILQGCTAEELEGKPDSSASSRTQNEYGYDLVRPIKDKTVSLHTSGNAICPNSKPTAVKTYKGGQRKPGRPAKVKISGISVTVDAISPQERKVCINSVLPPLDQESSTSNKLFADTPIKDSDSYKESSVRIQNDCETSSKESVGESVKSALPLRHSVRVRKPSLYYLHSFANSCSFSQSSALVRKSRKLLLNKAGNELAKSRKLGIKVVSENITSSVTSESNQEETKNEVAEFDCDFEISADPIFISRTSLRWWHTSTSKQTLQEELDMRFEQINSGWLPVDAAELIASDKRKYPVQLERVTKSLMVAEDNEQVQMSPIRMLFQGNCNMDKICAWFMQTTETHSLSIVRKENARDPIEVLNANGVIAAASQVDTCSSPQAEHLKKHLKKFALESPVRPRGHFHLSNRMSKFKVFTAKRRLLVGHNKRVCCKPQHSSHKKLSHHRVQYKQWKSVWKCVNGNPQYQSLKQDSANTVESKTSQKTELEINSFPPEKESVLLPSGKENENQDKPIPVNYMDAGCTVVQNLNSTNHSKCKRTEKLESAAKLSEQEESIVEGQEKNTFRNANWKLENFKECRVFLRKINSLDQSHFRNYGAWQQSKNSSFDTKGTSNLQWYTEENSDPCIEINAPDNTFETQSLNSAGPTLCELKGKRKHTERTYENGLSSSPSKKVKHFACKQSIPCQVDNNQLPSLGSNSNPINEKISQKENAGKRKRPTGVNTVPTSLKRMRRSSVEQRLPYNQLQFQIGNSS